MKAVRLFGGEVGTPIIILNRTKRQLYVKVIEGFGETTIYIEEKEK